MFLVIDIQKFVNDLATIDGYNCGDNYVNMIINDHVNFLSQLVVIRILNMDRLL